MHYETYMYYNAHFMHKYNYLYYCKYAMCMLVVTSGQWNAHTQISGTMLCQLSYTVSSLME